jgi:hypothetical protein
VCVVTVRRYIQLNSDSISFVMHFHQYYLLFHLSSDCLSQSVMYFNTVEADLSRNHCMCPSSNSDIIEIQTSTTLKLCRITLHYFHPFFFVILYILGEQLK